MNKPIQQRTLKTRAKLLEATRAIVAEVGYDGLRTEQVVKRAGVAKGTFFAHFRDKDALLDILIGGDMLAALDDMAAQPAPRDLNQIMDRLNPLMALMTSNRTVFDVILRHSGAAAIETIGPIAESFGRMIEVFAAWFTPDGDHPFRTDVTPELLAEGVQAFMLQALGLQFCALHNALSVDERLGPYLQAWLLPVR
ncbi:TetR family transcriptional regulator [Actibacterium mucosum KCTC 23349]|uniref:TetR family transcriptional regulator n=1 Tax=Actibacterium mucosum KCTC 23349 TaxID=1454373 RepID=A0A037ZNY4_9RHOB|nr:TetR/AcrR family transcriptional regulator [Actibacterium mucosum]KAJ57370.1 TetR family transcriptional regulator [Actibacterium mucosum KCTC 23349]